jgi:hypothetical protein
MSRLLNKMLVIANDSSDYHSKMNHIMRVADEQAYCKKWYSYT